MRNLKQKEPSIYLNSFSKRSIVIALTDRDYDNGMQPDPQGLRAPYYSS